MARDRAAEAGLSLEGTVSDICKQAGVNRTHVYEKKVQLTKAFEKVELPEPGRTPKKITPASGQDTAGWALQVTALQYRLDNPGVFVLHSGGHTGYSPGFKRIILDLSWSSWGRATVTCCKITKRG